MLGSRTGRIAHEGCGGTLHTLFYQVQETRKNKTSKHRSIRLPIFYCDKCNKVVKTKIHSRGGNLMPVLIQDNYVTCPCGCKHTFEVQRKAGGGAHYVKSTNNLASRHIQILTVWYSNEMRDSWFTKNELRDQLYNLGLTISHGSLSARISEIYKVDLIYSTANDKTHPHYTAGIPKYALNLPAVAKFLNGDLS